MSKQPKIGIFGPFLPFFANFCNYLKNGSLFVPKILQELKAQKGLGYGVVILTIQLIFGQQQAKISILGPNVSKVQTFCLFIFFWFKINKNAQEMSKMSKQPKISIVPPFFAFFLQTFAIISKTVHYFFLKFCRNLRHNKGLGSF